MDLQAESKVIEQKVQEQNITQNNVIENNKEEAPKSGKDWEKFREARAAERRQAEEMSRQAEKSAAEAQALKAAMESLLNKPQQQYNQSYQDASEESEEQRIEKLVEAGIARREAQLDKNRREKEYQETPQRLQNTFQDFNQVCTTENLDYLEYHYPEVATAFKHSPDGFDKWAAVYKAVKRFVPNTDSSKDSKKADQNFNKPQSLSSPQVSAQTSGVGAVRLDDKRKEDNWQRMQRALKGIN
jgi:hypothetical protein